MTKFEYSTSNKNLLRSDNLALLADSLTSPGDGRNNECPNETPPKSELEAQDPIDTDTANGDVSGSDTASERALLLVPIDQYQHGMEFEVLGRLPASLVISLLSPPTGPQPEVLSRPDEYIGYVVRSAFDTGQVRTITTVFTRNFLDPEVSYEFGSDAQIFSIDLNLFRTTVHRVRPFEAKMEL